MRRLCAEHLPTSFLILYSEKAMTQLLPKVEFAFQSLFKHQKKCPHCNSNSISGLAKKYANVSIKQCDACELNFTSPIYQSAFVSEFYDFVYGAEGSTTQMPTDDEVEVLKRDNFEGSDKNFLDRVLRLKEVCGGSKLLELGSSWGYFLYQAQQQGFETAGIELSDSRREFGKRKLGVDVFKTFEDLPEGFFDIVYTAHTLEHFIDLSSIFSDIHQVLNEKGFLVIEVPNFDYDLFGSAVLPIMGAIHPLGFSSKFFSKNLPDYGFDILGFFDSWNDFPNKASQRSHDDVVLLLAQKRTA